MRKASCYNRVIRAGYSGRVRDCNVLEAINKRRKERNYSVVFCIGESTYLLNMAVCKGWSFWSEQYKHPILLSLFSVLILYLHLNYHPSSTNFPKKAWFIVHTTLFHATRLGLEFVFSFFVSLSCWGFQESYDCGHSEELNFLLRVHSLELVLLCIVMLHLEYDNFI